MNGFGFKMPWYLRLGAPLVLRYTLKKRWMPAGMKTPLPPAQSPTAGDIAALDALLITLAHYRQSTHPLHPSPLFGNISREQWDQIHLIHSAHHLSFAIPTTPVATS